MLEDKVYTFEEVLDEKGFVIYTNVGYSMLPLLRQKRDIIEIHKKGPGRCEKYDVVLYKRGETYILHRILKVLPDGYIIAGDHNTFLETDVTDNMILGVMYRVIRDGRTVTMNNIWYKTYVHLWCDAYPLRMLILSLKSKIWPVLSKIKHKIMKDSSSNTDL